MGKIARLESLLEPFESKAKVVLSSHPKTRNVRKIMDYNDRRQWAHHLLRLAGSLPKIVSSEERLMSQVVQQEALTRLLVEKGIFSKGEFLEMVKVVDREMKRKKKVAV